MSIKQSTHLIMQELSGTQASMGKIMEVTEMPTTILATDATAVWTCAVGHYVIISTATKECENKTE